MSTAVEWERENEPTLKEIKAALADSDPYLAAEVLDHLAPSPDGDTLHAREKRFNREVEIIDPTTGQLHNADGPAVVRSDGTRLWYFKGLQHNASGPAVIKPNGDLRYYYHGTKCNNAEVLDDTVKRAKEWAAKSKNVRNVKAPHSET